MDTAYKLEQNRIPQVVWDVFARQHEKTSSSKPSYIEKVSSSGKVFYEEESAHFEKPSYLVGGAVDMR